MSTKRSSISKYCKVRELQNLKLWDVLNRNVRTPMFPGWWCYVSCCGYSDNSIETEEISSLCSSGPAIVFPLDQNVYINVHASIQIVWLGRYHRYAGSCTLYTLFRTLIQVFAAWAALWSIGIPCMTRIYSRFRSIEHSREPWRMVAARSWL